MNLLITAWEKYQAVFQGGYTWGWLVDVGTQRTSFTQESCHVLGNYTNEGSLYIAFSVLGFDAADNEYNVFAIQNNVQTGDPASYVGNPPNDGPYGWISCMPTTGDVYKELRGTATVTLDDLPPFVKMVFHGRLVAGDTDIFFDWTYEPAESFTLEPATYTFRYPIKYLEYEEDGSLYVSLDYLLDPDSTPFFTDGTDADMEYVLGAPFDMEYVLEASAVARMMRLRTLDMFTPTRL